jgi:hypothetical protein
MRKVTMEKVYDENGTLQTIEFYPESCPFCPDPDEDPMPRCRTIDVYAEESGQLVNCPFCCGFNRDDFVLCICTDGNDFCGWEVFKYGPFEMQGAPVTDEDCIDDNMPTID